MILAFSLLALLVATNTGAQRIKGGPRIVSEPVIQEPHIHVGKGGGGGAALHHTAVVTDPVSLNPVVVEKVTPIGSSGGIKTAGLGQFSLNDAQISSFGPSRLYRSGLSAVPFGLSGHDYYSYPASLLSARRGLRKTIVSDNLSGLSPIGYGGRKSAIIADPTTSQFTVGDAQIRTTAFGGRGLYRTGLSPVPFGLSGQDYYSYPASLLSRRGLVGGLGQTRILSGGGFTAGDAQISSIVADPIGQERVIVESAPAFGGPSIVQAAQEPEQITTIVEEGDYGQRKVTTVTKAAGGLRGGNIILRGGPALGLRRVKSRPVIQAAAPVQEVLVDPTSGLGAPFGGFGQRQVVTKTVAPAPAPVVVARAPAPIVSAPQFVSGPQFVSRPQFVSGPQFVSAPVIQAPIRRRLGEAFLTQAARPLVAARRVATLARPIAVSQPQVAVVQQAPPFPGNIQFTLGGTQIIGGGQAFAAAPAPIIAAPRPVAFQRPAVAVQRPVYAVQRPVVAAPRPVVVSQPAFAAPRPVVVSQPVVAAPRPVVVAQQPVISQVKTAGFGARRVLARTAPQMVYVDGGSRFPGIDIIGGYRIGDPRYNYAQLPISTGRFANLGLSQGSIDAGPVLVAPAPAPALLRTKSPFSASVPVAKTISAANTLGLSGIGQAPTQVVTQEEVIGPSGGRAVVTTVQEAGPSKIGGPVVAGPLGLTGVGQTGSTKTITQEEVIGPAGDSQIVTTVTKSAPSKIGGAVVSSPLGLAAVGQTSPAQVVTQEEVVGPTGERAVITTVQDAGPSKIGGPVVAGPLGLRGIGQTGTTKTITQEEVVGPAGDTQVVTTVTENAAAPSKIGGQVLSSPFGLTAVGQAPTKVITQEEVIGPAGDSQVITTVQETSPVVQQEEVVGLSGISSLTASPLSQEIAQSALTQETLGDSAIISSGLSPFSQSAIDPISSGQTQLSIDDVIGPSSGGVTTITQLADGSVTKVTEVSQQDISDPVVQQSIDDGGIGGGFGLGGYVPRISFMSQHPYDVPSRALLRQTLTRPIVQEQQQLEQILVR